MSTNTGAFFISPFDVVYRFPWLRLIRLVTHTVFEYRLRLRFGSRSALVHANTSRIPIRSCRPGEKQGPERYVGPASRNTFNIPLINRRSRFSTACSKQLQLSLAASISYLKYPRSTTVIPRGVTVNRLRSSSGSYPMVVPCGMRLCLSMMAFLILQ